MSEEFDDYYYDTKQADLDPEEVMELAKELFVRITVHQATTDSCWDPRTRAKYDAEHAIDAALTFFDCWDKTHRSDPRVSRYYVG